MVLLILEFTVATANCLQFSILCTAYNPLHKELYSGSQDCLIKAWDAQTGQLLRKQTGHGGWVTDLLFVPELRLLFSCSIDHTIRVWSDKGKQAQVDDAGPSMTCVKTARAMFVIDTWQLSPACRLLSWLDQSFA